MNCWLIFFLLFCGRNNNVNCGYVEENVCDCGCHNHKHENCGCVNDRNNDCDCGCQMEREDDCNCGCDNDRRDNNRRENNRRDSEQWGMTTPPWAKSGEYGRDDSCGCQNR